MPCSRAMSVGDAPGARLCAAIVCFCSIVQRRRRSPRGINVCALSVDAAVSTGVASVSRGESSALSPGVSIQKWIVNGGTPVGLPRVERGAVLVHLMAGSIAVIGKDSRVARMEGDRWTVPQGQDVAVEAGDDSAVLMVTIVRPR
jgi:hypothetical protein